MAITIPKWSEAGYTSFQIYKETAELYDDQPVSITAQLNLFLGKQHNNKMIHKVHHWILNLVCKIH